MKIQKMKIAGVPACLYGERSRRVWLYVHGRMGSREDARAFAESACPLGYQVLAVDLPEHGTRRGQPEKLLPWVAVPELQAVYAAMVRVWPQISLYGVSIGAWLSMQALQDAKLHSALLVSPVVDMEDVITNMMRRAGVTEAGLEQRCEIVTDFGETLSWSYLCWVREHPLRWKTPTQVLYGERDGLTSRVAIERFRQNSGAHLTIVEDGEHWFHTELQLAVQQEWERTYL